MMFYYKTINGVIGKSNKLYRIPKDVDTLLVRRYDGEEIEFGKINKVIVDADWHTMARMCFDCVELKIYRPSPIGFRLNDIVYTNVEETYVKKLTRFKSNGIDNLVGVFNNTGLEWCCPLDISGVKAYSYLFHGCKLKHIPELTLSDGMRYEYALDESGIPNDKVKTLDILMRIGKMST